MDQAVALQVAVHPPDRTIVGRGGQGLLPHPEGGLGVDQVSGGADDVAGGGVVLGEGPGAVAGRRRTVGGLDLEGGDDRRQVEGESGGVGDQERTGRLPRDPPMDRPGVGIARHRARPPPPAQARPPAGGVAGGAARWPHGAPGPPPPGCGAGAPPSRRPAARWRCRYPRAPRSQAAGTPGRACWVASRWRTSASSTSTSSACIRTVTGGVSATGDVDVDWFGRLRSGVGEVVDQLGGGVDVLLDHLLDDGLAAADLFMRLTI